MLEATVVLDIGKTNVKLCALSLATGQLVDCQRRPNEVQFDGPYPHADTEGIWSWFLAALADMAARMTVRSIGITTHGATVACLAGEELALPVLDYEYPEIDTTREAYRSLRPAFAESRSPDLPAGLNLGAQLYWLQQRFPEAFDRVTTLLTYPQYWGWRLSGVVASEVTSLGCHTDLWNPAAGDFSSMVDGRGWRSLFPPMQATGSVLGPVHRSLAKRLRLPGDCQVYNGIHDSNASLVPHLLHHPGPFGVVSSGTWTVMAGIGSPLDALDPAADMLANVSAYNEPVPCIRFMGGREWETLRGDPECQWRDLADVLALDVYAIPSFVDQGGPFQHHPGRFTGPVHRLNGRQKTALASLYVSLMTDYCLDRLQQTGDLIVEGAFADNRLYLTLLATLRPDGAVLCSHDRTGTTLGTAMLSNPSRDWSFDYERVSADGSIRDAMVAYRDRWRALLP